MDERYSNAPLRPPARIDMDRDLHYFQEQRIKMEKPKTNKCLIYDNVSFRHRSGALTLSQTGIVFESREADTESGKKSPLSYRAPWHTIKKYRLNGSKEPDALLRLSVAANYGEGDEVETIIFGLSSRQELESLRDDIGIHLRRLENDNYTDTTMSMSYSHGSGSVSSISHSEAPPRHLPIPEDHSSLVLLVYDYLLSASDQTKQAFAEGIVADHPDKVLRAIQQREGHTGAVSPPSNAASIFRQTSQDRPNENVARPQKKLSCVIEDIDSVVDSDEAASRERELSRGLSVSAVSTTAEASVTCNDDLISAAAVKEPSLLAGAQRAQESREMIHLAQCLDEKDRQAKDISASEHSGKAGLRRSGRKSSFGSSDTMKIHADDKNGEKQSDQETKQEEEEDDGQTEQDGQTLPDESYSDLKRNILEHLKQHPGVSGPGAFPVSDDPGIPAEYEASPEPEHTIDDEMLIEAYLVAQEASVCVPEAPGSQTSDEFEAKKKTFWELSEAEFLDALNKVMKEKIAEPMPAEDIAAVVSAVATRVDDNRKPAAVAKHETREIHAPKVQQMDRPAMASEPQRSTGIPKQGPPTPANHVENEDACCCL